MHMALSARHMAAYTAFYLTLFSLLPCRHSTSTPVCDGFAPTAHA